MIDKSPAAFLWCSAVDDIGLMAVVARATDTTHEAVKVAGARPGQQIVIYAHSGERWVQPLPPYLGS